jgi:hypothetical protein
LRHEERRDEHHVGATVGGELAGEVESEFGLLAVEQRHDDAAVPDRRGTAGEAAGAAMDEVEVGPFHRRSW